MDGMIFLFLVFVFLLWFFWWKPQSDQAKAKRELQAEKLRAERERREIENHVLKEAETVRLKDDFEQLLKSIRVKAPGFILDARLAFEKEYRSKGGEGTFGQEMSPLVCFGYRVGKTNGRTETERRDILTYAIAADLNVTLKFLPISYRDEWGAPLSVTRLQRIHQHLNNMASRSDGRRNFEVAISHWRSDAAWFHAQQRPIVEKYRAI